MKITHIRTVEEFKKYQEHWDRILESNENSNPFIEFQWVLDWWLLLGKEQYVEILAVQRKDEWIAFFPFQFSPKWKSTVIEFMGRDEATYMDVVVYDEERRSTVAFVLDHLISTIPNVIFNLQGLQSSSKTTNIIFAYLKKRKYSSHVYSVVSPYIHIENLEMNEYLKPRRKLHGLERREKRLRLLGEVTVSTIDLSEMNSVFDLHEKHWQKRVDTSKFTESSQKNFYRTLLSFKGQPTEVKVDALFLNKQMIAFTYGFICRGRYITYLLGHDDDYNMYSPGRILLKELIADSKNHGIRTFDMGVGYEPYKLDWNTGLDTTNSILFSSKELTTKFMVQLMRGKSYLKTAFNKNHKAVLFKRRILGHTSHFVKHVKEIKWLNGLNEFRKSLFSRKSIDVYHQPHGKASEVDFQLMSHEEVTKEETEHGDVNKRFFSGYLPYRSMDDSMFWVNPKVIRMDDFDYLESLPKQSFFVDDWQVHQLPDICAFLRHEQKVKNIYISTSKRDESLIKHLKHLGFTRVNHISKVKIFNISKTRVFSEIK